MSFFPVKKAAAVPTPDRPANQCTFTAACQGTDQESSTGSAANPCEVPFLVVPAKLMGRSGTDFVILAVHLDRLQRKLQARPALQSSRLVGINHQSLDVGTPWDGRLVCNDDRL
jgi:hypothetical protein